MTQVNTTYENLGPIVKAIGLMQYNEFFQLPEEGAVYRLVSRTGDTCNAICLDDLTLVTFPDNTVVEPREVNKVDVKVELL